MGLPPRMAAAARRIVAAVGRARLLPLALLAAGRIIGESLDAKKHRELIERAIQETEIRA